MSASGKHQGVVAQLSAFAYSTVEDVFALAERKGEEPFVFVLDGIEDPHNLGAIIRTANMAGAHGVIIPTQVFISKINGNNQCSGHSECDAIIMGNAKISAIPEITANNPDSALIHEAAIGKIAGDQIIKLMTLGLTEAEAEEQIVNGFLK